ncbi:MAG: DUF6691 family protein [Candidatus Binataceae bacterium]
MKAAVVSFLSGIVFALGLGISGMTEPSKIVGFLDFAGPWDPSLAFVMIGAIAVYFVLYRVAVKRGAPLLAPSFSLPTRRDIDSRLVAGAALFGVGWGLGGFCPGPAITSLAWGSTRVVAFVVAMAAAMYLHGVAASVGDARREPARETRPALADS